MSCQIRFPVTGQMVKYQPEYSAFMRTSLGVFERNVRIVQIERKDLESLSHKCGIMERYLNNPG